MPNGYNASAFPSSFKDPAYDQADQSAAAAVGIPAQWLSSIRTKGEKSNADQISGANAATPYQIIPSTRDAIIKQTGVDPYLSPQTAAYGAAYLLKQSLDRNGGNPILATAEYHGGTNRDAWGPKTMAYVKRVTGSSPNNANATPSWGDSSANGQNPYQLQAAPTVTAAPGSGESGPSPLAQLFNAYQNGKMTPDDAHAFEQDVKSGRVVLPAGMSVNQSQAQQSQTPTAPQQLVDAFNNGHMSDADAAQFQQDVKNGALRLPSGAKLTPAPPATAGRESGIAARGYVEGLSSAIDQYYEKGKAIANMPMDAIKAIGTGGGFVNAIDQLTGTHLASSMPGAQNPNPLAGAPKTVPDNSPTLQETANYRLNQVGAPTAQTDAERVLQAGAGGAGALTVPVPGMALKAIPTMVASGAAGGAVGEAVHQATGSQALGLAANLLTTVLSPAAASRVMKVIANEAPAGAAAIAGRTEPALPDGASARPADAAINPIPTAQRTESAQPVVAPTQPNAQVAAPDIASTGVAQPPTPSLAAQVNPGMPQVTNPALTALERERENLLPIAANAPSKGDPSLANQISVLEQRAFDSVAERTRELQDHGMKFGDARALAQKQLSGEMTAHQQMLANLQGQLDAAQAGSRAVQRLGEIDRQISQTPATSIAQRSAISSAIDEAMQPSAGARIIPGSNAQAAATAAQPAEAVPATTAAPAQSAAQDAAAASQSASTVNPAASPLSSAAQQFMTPEELAAQARKAVGAEGKPFGLDKRTAREVLATQGAPDAETLASAKRLGIADNLQPDHLTANQAYRELAQAIKSTPGSLARAEEMQGLQAVGQRAMQIIEDAGGTRDLSQLSSQVKSELMTMQQQLDQKAESLYKSIKQDVPAQMPAQAQNVLNFVQQRATDLGGAKNLSPIEKMIQAKLSPKESPITINGQPVRAADVGMPTQYQQPTYALLDDVRRDIGAGLRNQGPFKDADSGLLKALYKSVSEDQRSALSSVPGALEKFDAARSAVQMRKSVEDDLTSLFGKQLGDSVVGKLGTAMSSLPKGDETKLIELLKSVPASMRQQVTASGLGYAFGKATKNGDLNFKSFADWMDGLKKNSAAFNAVMGNLPAETRTQLLDLAKVSRGVSDATRESITTGRIMAAREELNAHADTLVGKVMNTAREAAVGHVGTAISAGAAHVAGPVGAGLSHAVISALSRGKPDVMKAADQLIASPEFQQLAREGATPSQQTIKATANSSAFRRLYDGARNASGANDPMARQRFLMGLIESTQSTSNNNTNR
ncbi:hypothetical protein KMC49_gp27 [Ralstonia phage Firinga]|uniref:Transglycosylase SLT domain-containing protein n=2 Tax=Firingavirus TaxID=2843381 RepID=A0A7G5B9X2_9CAUD|nr:putative transglycosylase [Ralstonia phage RSK1]YP_010078566.1 hypothetical protein KMC49_gp27 [Ralstonia phage Firinga]QMV33095.1 hypothetical protein 18C_00027 [Ralstonia phage Firinga]BAO04681.1 putative transglycosylase [Ralstonia phage RSK1]